MFNKFLNFCSEMCNRKKILNHAGKYYGFKIPDIIVPDIQATPDDITIAKRLLSTYKRTTEISFKPSQSDLWFYIKNNQKKFLDLLK